LGRMTEEKKQGLLKQLTETKDDSACQAVENLYQQSQLGAFGDMIL